MFPFWLLRYLGKIEFSWFLQGRYHLYEPTAFLLLLFEQSMCRFAILHVMSRIMLIFSKNYMKNHCRLFMNGHGTKVTSNRWSHMTFSDLLSLGLQGLQKIRGDCSSTAHRLRI